MWSLYLAIGAGSIPVLFLINDEYRNHTLYSTVQYIRGSKQAVLVLMHVALSFLTLGGLQS